MVTTVTTTTTTISTTTTTEVKKDVEKPVETSIKAEVDKMMAEEDSRLRMTRRTAVAIDQGNLYFKDRVKEMMKVKASWVGPAEIESCIEQKPEVLESCVWVGSGLFRRSTKTILYRAPTAKTSAMTSSTPPW